jgi:hypothetical protein
MNAATRLSDRGQAGQLDRADLKQPTPKRTVGRVAPIQRRKVIESTQGFTRPQQGRGFFGNSLTWLVACAHSVTAAVRGCVLPRKT